MYLKDKDNLWRPKKRIQASKDIPFLRRKVQESRQEISIKSHIIYKKAVELDDLDYFKTEMGKLSKEYSQLYRLVLLQKKDFLGVIKLIPRKILNKISR